LDWNSIEKWDYIVTAVASDYHRKFSMVEREDIKQSLYQWFAEHPNKLKDWEAIGEKDAKNLIYRSLRNQALDYCQRWKAKSLGYDLSDLHYYDSEIIEALLPPVLRGEYGVTHKLNLGFTGKPSAPAEGGNLTIMMLEIDSGYWKLNKEDRNIISLRFAENLDFGEMANILELGTDSAARMRLKRSISRLINKIGGYKPFRDIDSPDKNESEEDNIEQTDIHSDTDKGNKNGSDEE
jgi:DNA-directed RNA polymerase specialized sigma24 family protein